jgi:hypothetical protein
MIKIPTNSYCNCSSNILPSLFLCYSNNFWIVDNHHPEQFLGFSTNPEIITTETGQTGFDITIASIDFTFKYFKN